MMCYYYFLYFIPVVYGAKKYCESEKAIRLHSHKGRLSSHVTDETGCGALSSPWIIEALRGQTVNISMYDFGPRDPPIPGIPDGKARRSTHCDIYGYIVEPGINRNTSICGGHGRNVTLYASDTNIVEIHVIPSAQRQIDSHFLLNYQGTGVVLCLTVIYVVFLYVICFKW